MLKTLEEVGAWIAVNGEGIYAFCMGAPAGDLRILSLGTDARLAEKPVTAVQQLGSAAKTEWQQEAGALVIKNPAGTESAALAFRIRLGE
jgi:alpha-L-fucosidase